MAFAFSSAFAALAWNLHGIGGVRESAPSQAAEAMLRVLAFFDSWHWEEFHKSRIEQE